MNRRNRDTRGIKSDLNQDLITFIKRDNKNMLKQDMSHTQGEVKASTALDKHSTDTSHIRGNGLIQTEAKKHTTHEQTLTKITQSLGYTLLYGKQKTTQVKSKAQTKQILNSFKLGQLSTSRRNIFDGHKTMWTAQVLT